MLTERQLETVQSPSLKLRVIAGPGTGKTTVLTHRIAHLVSEGVDPARICALTFSRKAAAEMKTRALSLVPRAAGRLHASTFHSLCYRTLASRGLLRDGILTAAERRKLIAEVARARRIDIPPRVLALEISRLKNRMLEPAPDCPWSDKALEVYRDYERLKEGLDYDDLILHTVQLLRHDGASLRERFLHVLVDEFQDVSRSQYELLKLLAQDRTKGIFAVGDPAQCIYEWRMASPECIRKLEEDFQTATIHLRENFRSRPGIVELANRILRRIDPDRPALEPVLGGEARIALLEAEDEIQEARIVAEALKESGEPGECAVLVRTNAQIEPIEREFARAGIPFSESHSFYHRAEIRTALEMMKGILRPDEHPHGLLRAARLLDPYLGREFREELLEKASSTGLEDALKGRFSKPYMTVGARKIREFLERVREVDRKRGPGAALGEIRRVLRLDAALPATVHVPDLEEESEIVRNLNRLQATAEEFGSTEEFLAFTEEQVRSAGKRGAVNVLTIHRAKGLEFKHVWVAGLTEGVFPVPGNLAEEWRLFYVAVTRARETLTLCHPRRYLGEPRRKSPFLELLAAGETRAEAKHESPIKKALRAMKGILVPKT